MSTLSETLDSVRKKIQRIGSTPINEENTRATLIDPVLRALGSAFPGCHVGRKRVPWRRLPEVLLVS